MLITATLVLSVAVFTGMICGEHEQYEVCNDDLEVLNAIKSCPDNYQQLINAFYPINRAKPSDVIIAYFTNYTDPLPEECSLGTYPWRTCPGINHTYHNIYWYMWTTNIIINFAGNLHMIELGEYLPIISYNQLFNKTSPFSLPTPIACIKIPLECKELGDLGTVTTQVKSLIVQKGQYSENKDTSKQTRVFFEWLAGNCMATDVRNMHHSMQIDAYLHAHHKQLHQRGAGTVLFLLIIAAPYILHCIGKNQLVSLQQSRSKAKVPSFWAVASLSHVFNIYITAEMLTLSCNQNNILRNTKHTVTMCSTVIITGFIFVFIASGITAYIHSKYITFPIPKTWSIITKCCRRKQHVHRIITTTSIWGIYMSAMFLILHFPFQFLLVSVNPHLYGFAILTVWSAMFVCIIVTAIPFTIDQIFIKEEEYRITPKQALRQILLLMFIAVLVFGFGSLTFSITLLLHLSKYGEETRTFSSSLMFVLHHTLLPIGAWIIRRVGVKVKESVQQMLNAQDKI